MEDSGSDGESEDLDPTDPAAEPAPAMASLALGMEFSFLPSISITLSSRLLISRYCCCLLCRGSGGFDFPHSTITVEPLPRASIAVIMLFVLSSTITSPKTTCFPFSLGVGFMVMKNCELRHSIDVISVSKEWKEKSKEII